MWPFFKDHIVTSFIYAENKSNYERKFMSVAYGDNFSNSFIVTVSSILVYALIVNVNPLLFVLKYPLGLCNKIYQQVYSAARL